MFLDNIILNIDFGIKVKNHFNRKCASRFIKPDIQGCLEEPWKLKHIFTCKKDKLKTLYGKYAINKQKSELIVQKFSEYFTVNYIE